MSKKYLKINELIPYKIYDIENNEYPNHIYYFVDDKGNLYRKDVIVKCEVIADYLPYNKVIKMNFIDEATPYKVKYLNKKNKNL